jgi:hypothetical protein
MHRITGKNRKGAFSCRLLMDAVSRGLKKALEYQHQRKSTINENRNPAFGWQFKLSFGAPFRVAWICNSERAFEQVKAAKKNK